MSLRPRGLGAILAVALVASCSSPQTALVEGTRAEPDATVATDAPDEVVISRTDFQIVYRLEGESAGSGSVGLISNRQLTFESSLADRAAVEEGQTVGAAVIDSDVDAALQAGAATSSLDAARLDQLRSMQGPVVAPVSGILELDGAQPAVSSPGIDVVVGLSPIQDLRYRSLPFTGRAVIETIVGEREVDCDAVWIEELSATEPEESEESFGVETASASEIHCRLPRHIETAAGLRARLTLESKRLDDVVVVPNVYVGYDGETDGHYIRVLQDGRPRNVPVVVGVTDGVVRVISSEAPVGTVLLPLGGS